MRHGSLGWELPEVRSIFGRRPFQVTIAFFAIVVLLISGLPQPKPPSGTSQLQTDTGSGGTGNATFYPYIANSSLFPLPDTLPLGNMTSGFYPRITSTVIDGVPTFLLVAVVPGWANYTHGFVHAYEPADLLDVFAGTYSGSDAVGILNGSSSDHLPIQWGAPTTVAFAFTSWGLIDGLQPTPVISSDSIAASTNGNDLYVAMGLQNGSSYVYASINQGAWAPLTSAHGIEGADPQIAFGGAALLVATRTSSSIITTTYYLSGINATTNTISVTAVHDAVAWYPSAGMGEECILVSTASDQLELYGSYDGGHTLTSQLVGNYSNSSANGTVFNSIGGTPLSSSVGYPGQVALTVEGSTLFGMYTSELANQVVAATTISSNGGVHWTNPDFTVLSNTSVANPSIAPSAAGYVYATWLFDKGGSWTVDAAEYGEDGRLIAGPSPLPGSTPGGPTPNAYTSVTVDAYGRPMYVWSIPAPDGNACSNCYFTSLISAPEKAQTIQYDGAFLSPANVLSLLQQHLNQLSSWDFKGGKTWTLGSALTATIGVITRAIANFSSTKSSSWLCGAQNSTASALYTNITHYELTYQTGTSVCGTFSHPVADTTAGNSNGVATAPPNYGWSQPISWTMGPQTANTFLGTLADWTLESIGVPVPFSGDPLRGFNPVTDVVPELATPVVASTVSSNSTVSISDLVTALNPTTAIVSPTATLPTLISGTWDVHGQNCPGGGTGTFLYEDRGAPSTYVQSASVENNSGRDVATTFEPAYLTNLTPNATIHWNATYTVHFAGSNWVNECTQGWQYSNTATLPARGIPSSLTFNLAGAVVTTERMVPEAPIIIASGSGSSLSLNYYWNNTMPSQANTSLAYDGLNPVYHSSTSYSVPEALGTYTATVGDGYQASMSANSQASTGWNRSQVPSISANEAFSSPAITTSYGCYFDLGDNPITMSSFSVNNITSGPGGTATVSWTANVDGTGFVTYYELGVATNLTQSAVVTGSGSAYHYFVQMHALSPSSLFYVNGVTSLGDGCLTFQKNASTTFNTLGKFSIFETDLPYDSISQTGGGAMITWQLPANISRYAIANASAVLVNNTAHPTSVVYSVSNVSQIESTPGQFALNLTPTSLNTSYTCSMFLNFTYTPHGGHALYWNITSWPLTFVYEKDTSGDGLTDAEKKHGWLVLTAGAPGGETWSYETLVKANPNLQATNGLVSDFVEKEFGLDPDTVDTASSHMLDTWNLTFNLGSLNHTYSLPPSLANLRYWNENGTYNPFATAQYPGGTKLNGPLSSSMTNKTQDDSPWAAEVLWPYSDLQKFVNYSGVQNASWLRAVFGNWSGDRTLTIWGKLSWGANPHVQSTPGDNVPDGSRVNPVNDEAIELYFGSFPNGEGGGSFALNPNATSGGCGNVPNGAGIALRFSSSAATGGLAGKNYSSQFLATCGSGTSGNSTTYDLSIPVANQTQATQNVQISMWANVSTNSTPEPLQLPISGCHLDYNVSIDMLNATAVNPGGLARKFLWANGHGGCGSGVARTETGFGWSEVPIGIKTPTYLWVPDGNGTLSSLPWGLKQYTGEESFALVVVNNKDTSTDTSATVPLPWGGSAGGISVTPGLNSFLIPREQFMSSPLGEALLLNRTIPNGSVNGGSLLAGSNGGAVLNGGSQGTLSQLACFWQTRSVSQTSKAYTCGTSTYGIARNSSLAVKVLSDLNCSIGSCGGSQSHPGLENTSDEGAAVTNTILLNLSYGGASTAQVLDTILAGIVMNSSGGVNGSLVAVTNQLPELGLDSIVLSNIANVTYPSGGLYGLAYSKATPPAPSCSGLTLGGYCFNAAIGTEIVGGLAMAFALSPLGAVLDYFACGPEFFGEVGGAITGATAAALAYAGSVMSKELAWLANFIVQEIQALLDPITTPFVQADRAYSLALIGDYQRIIADTSGGQRITPSDALAFIGDFGGSLLTFALSLSGVTLVAFGVLSAVSFGAGFFIPILIGCLISSSQQSETQGYSRVSIDNAGLTVLDRPLVNATEAGANSTNPPSRNATNYTSNWGGSDSIASILGSLVTFSLGFAVLFGTLAAAQGNPTLAAGKGLYISAICFALGVIGLGVSLYTLGSDSTLGNIIGLAFAVVSGVCDIFAIITEKNPDIQDINYVTAGIDGAGLLLALYSLKKIP